MTVVVLDKPGRSKFAPVLGPALGSGDAGARRRVAAPVVTPRMPQAFHAEENNANDHIAGQHEPLPIPKESAKDNTENIPTVASPVPAAPSSSVAIETVQSRRGKQKSSLEVDQQSPSWDIDLLSENSLPSFGAQYFATAAATCSTNSEKSLKQTLSGSHTASSRITMAHFLKDSGTGIPMSSGSGSSTRLSSAPSSSTPGRSRATTPPAAVMSAFSSTSRSVTTVLAPQVRIVNGEIVVDDEVATHITPPTTPSSDTFPMDVIYEGTSGGRHLTSHAFVRTTGNNRWKAEETEKFYRALSMCGTDFSLIAQFFPNRSREQVKGKYKIEERSNPGRVALFLKNRQPFGKSEN